MIAVDTNVLVRFLTCDEESQYRKAVTVLEGGDVFIPETIWLETEWVLRYAYGFDAAAVVRAFRAVLGLPAIHTADASRLLLALEWHAAGLDFADALHLSGSQEAETFLTFDQAFVRKAAGLGHCRVAQPG